MTKPKYEKPIITSIGLPIKRAQGFDTEGACFTGNDAGGSGGVCDSGLDTTSDIPTGCNSGSIAEKYTCSSGDIEKDDGCTDGYTIYGGAACGAGSNN